MEALALHQTHESAGARFTELAGREIVAAFSDAATEDAATRSGVALVDASYRDLLRFTGPDRVRFLQGMLTQDVAALAEGASAPTALCTAKGALVAAGELTHIGEELWLSLEPGLGARARAALERFLIADEVEISDGRTEWAELDLWGPKALTAAEAVLGRPLSRRPGAPPLSRSPTAERDAMVSAPARFGSNLAGVRFFVARSRVAESWDALRASGATPCGFDVQEAWRVEAGVPRFGAEMDEETLPLEVGLESSISYTKGCYLGQEVIARATYRGHVNWKLGGIALGAQALPVGTELTRGGKPVGRLTSVVMAPHQEQFIALARLRHEIEQGTLLDAGGRQVHVHSLPFVA